ncbi:MAG TPA: CocE/NonD family hydrolase [Gaiellaceae bacterium]|nr:CocE/NonD family hydrolase [Gaiellaceae bacterium]
MSTVAHPSAESGRAVATRVAAALRTEVGLVRLALAVVALHIVDENYLQPEPGTSAGDQLASGLIPIAVLAAVAAIYPRLRAGVRAATAMTFGALGITVGVPAVYFTLEGDVSGDHYTGFLALAAGVALLLAGRIILWKARRTDGTRSQRYLRRLAIAVGAPFLALAILWFVVFPVGFAYIYTHTGRGVVTPELGVPYESVAVTTSDSIDLSAFYVPSKNRAAVILFPGATNPGEARMLIRHGYGVLLLTPRGQGSSEGDTVRWAGDRDLHGGLDYLRRRPDVDPDRIGAIGFSIGGEMLLEAAAQSNGFKAVISEGAGSRVGDEDLSGPGRLTGEPMLAMMTAAVTVFGNHGPPPPIVDRIGRISPTPLFLIHAPIGIGGESTRQPKYYAAAGNPKASWEVSGSKHTGGFEAQPKEYERRVIAFFDAALRG